MNPMSNSATEFAINAIASEARAKALDEAMKAVIKLLGSRQPEVNTAYISAVEAILALKDKQS